MQNAKVQVRMGRIRFLKRKNDAGERVALSIVAVAYLFPSSEPKEHVVDSRNIKYPWS